MKDRIMGTGLMACALLSGAGSLAIATLAAADLAAGRFGSLPGIAAAVFSGAVFAVLGSLAAYGYFVLGKRRLFP